MVLASSRWSRPGATPSGWATTTGRSTPQDGSLAAHFEFTVAIDGDGPADPHSVARSTAARGGLRRTGSARPRGPRFARRPRPLRRCYYPSVRCPERVCLLQASVPRRGSGGPNGSQSRAAGLQSKGIMKVRPSVKPMCEKCKIIRRHGAVLVICQSAPQAAAGLRRWLVSPASTLPSYRGKGRCRGAGFSSGSPTRQAPAFRSISIKPSIFLRRLPRRQRRCVLATSAGPTERHWRADQSRRGSSLAEEGRRRRTCARDDESWRGLRARTRRSTRHGCRTDVVSEGRRRRAMPWGWPISPFYITREKACCATSRQR